MPICAVQRDKKLRVREGKKGSGSEQPESNHRAVLSRPGRTYDSVPRFLNQKRSAFTSESHTTAQITAWH